MKSNSFYTSLLSAMLAAIFTFTLVTATPVAALRGARAPDAPPAPVISYQGRVTVNGQPYNGTGYFKFAIMEDESWVWRMSDPVALQVTNGLFDVLLGDANITNMPTIPNTVFSSPYRWLRVWFSTDGVTFSQLSPDRRLAWAPYAFEAYNASTLDGIDSVQFAIKDGTLQTNLNADLLDGSHASAFGLKDGSLQTNFNADLLDGTHASSFALKNGSLQSNLNADLLDGLHASGLQLPSGAMVLGLPDDANLLAAGYTSLGPSNTMAWRPTNTSGAPTQGYHTAIWTGSEMIIWGGVDGNNYVDTGARYNPSTDTWTALPTTGAPSARAYHSAVWTGNEMIIWGGSDLSLKFYDGARYNPTTNTWSTISNTGAPSARHHHTAVWTGSVMIIWGGQDSSGTLNTGKRYNPVSNTWADVTTSGAPTARWDYSAVWTGNEMIIWGGNDAEGRTNTGGCYNPATNSWAATDIGGTYHPAARSNHTAVWTGSQMIIWGGWGVPGGDLSSGALYDPTSNTWSQMVISESETLARSRHMAFWTGNEMLVWGGSQYDSGAAYDPEKQSWHRLSNIGDPTGNFDKSGTGVWTGSELVIWGGASIIDLAIMNEGARLLLELHLYRKP